MLGSAGNAEPRLMTVWYTVKQQGCGHVASGNTMGGQLQARSGPQCSCGMLAKLIPDCGMLASKGWERAPVHHSHPGDSLHTPTDAKLFSQKGSHQTFGYRFENIRFCTNTNSIIRIAS